MFSIVSEEFPVLDNSQFVEQEQSPFEKSVELIHFYRLYFFKLATGSWPSSFNLCVFFCSARWTAFRFFCFISSWLKAYSLQVWRASVSQMMILIIRSLILLLPDVLWYHFVICLLLVVSCSFWWAAIFRCLRRGSDGFRSKVYPACAPVCALTDCVHYLAVYNTSLCTLSDSCDRWKETRQPG